VSEFNRSAEDVKRTATILVAIGIVVALGIFASRDKKVIIRDFSWSISGKTAPYSFSISNKTKEEVHVVVTLDAENVSEGHEGTKLHPLGLSRVDVSLAGHETKKIEGTLDLLRSGSSATTVSYVAALEEPIQSSTAQRP
jgi:hypothetical protein